MTPSNAALTRLHSCAMDEINDVLIKLQDRTLEMAMAGEIPRRLSDWGHDDDTVLWWDTEMTGGEITEPPSYIGSPMDSDWPYGEEDLKHLLWVPLPKLARNKP